MQTDGAWCVGRQYRDLPLPLETTTNGTWRFCEPVPALLVMPARLDKLLTRLVVPAWPELPERLAMLARLAITALLGVPESLVCASKRYSEQTVTIHASISLYIHHLLLLNWCISICSADLSAVCGEPSSLANKSYRC